MKLDKKIKAIELRRRGLSIGVISAQLEVAKSSVSLWVRDVELSESQLRILGLKSRSRLSVEKRRLSRLANEKIKRETIILNAKNDISPLSKNELMVVGAMLYWAEGGKTQRMVRFSNGDPEMIKIMMYYFRHVCNVPERKFRGYIHIHPHLDYKKAEIYWSSVTNIPLSQFFKTYRIPNKSSQNKKDTLPNGVCDIYVLDTKLFLKITGWARGIFSSYA